MLNIVNKLFGGLGSKNLKTYDKIVKKINDFETEISKLDDQELKNKTQYFKNQFDQYFRYSPGENLITDGTEFIVEKTGKPYVGSYHIHPDKGPMVGAQHVKTPHDYLIPISGSNTQYRINKAETQKSNTTRSTRYSGGY